MFLWFDWVPQNSLGVLEARMVAVGCGGNSDGTPPLNLNNYRCLALPSLRYSQTIRAFLWTAGNYGNGSSD